VFGLAPRLHELQIPFVCVLCPCSQSPDLGDRLGMDRGEGIEKRRSA